MISFSSTFSISIGLKLPSMMFGMFLSISSISLSLEVPITAKISFCQLLDTGLAGLLSEDLVSALGCFSGDLILGATSVFVAISFPLSMLVFRVILFEGDDDFNGDLIATADSDLFPVLIPEVLAPFGTASSFFKKS